MVRADKRQRAGRPLRRPARPTRPDPVHPAVCPRTPQDEPADAREESDYVRELLHEYTESLEEDRRYLFATYRFLDMARKVVGVGSVGTRAWVFLFAGRNGEDPLVLQAKEAQPSVLERYLGASRYDNHGERVVRGQRMAQAAIDLFLSWQRSEDLGGNEHERDHQRLAEAVAAGEVIARIGV